MKALETQVGGNHYKTLAIQPVEYIHRNGLGFCEGSVVKYVTRWKDKGGIQDLEKAKHFIDLLIDIEQKAALSEKQIEIEYNPVKHTINHDEEEAWREAEKRMDAIGQNGPTGEHYIPEWVSEALASHTLPNWAEELELTAKGSVYVHGQGQSAKLCNLEPLALGLSRMPETWEVPK